MSQAERARIASVLLGCKPEEVQPRVKAMSAGELKRFSGCIDWVAAYEAQEKRLNEPEAA